MKCALATALVQAVLTNSIGHSAFVRAMESHLGKDTCSDLAVAWSLAHGRLQDRTIGMYSYYDALQEAYNAEVLRGD